MRKVDGPATNKVLRVAVVATAILTPMQVIIGDLHGLNTLAHQPAKVAAMEGLRQTQQGAPLTLFEVVDEPDRQTRYAFELPKVASLILTHEWDGEVRGLHDFVGQHPPVAPVFWPFRVMVGLGFVMLLVSWWTCWQLWRQSAPGLTTLRILFAMTFSGWVAVLAGWYVTEIGRQPWMVTGLITVKEVVADHPAGLVLSSLIAYALIYAFLLASYIAATFYLSSKPAQSLQVPHDYHLPSIATAGER